MSVVFVLSQNGKRLMPTNRCGHVRHLLKDGKAKIVSRHPFTIQLQYECPEIVQELEIGVDSGYINVGVSLKSKDKEFFSAEFELLENEKKKHDARRMYRRTRRNRLRYRKCRFNKNKKPKGWIAPSLRHKAEAQVQVVERICKVAPVTKVTVEVGKFDPALLKAIETGRDIPQGVDYQHGPLYFADSLRAAVFQRDNYTCQICKRSPLTSATPVYLHTHHALYWKGRHADTLDELITVCNKCHTRKNHQKGGKLWGLEPKVASLEGATFMNIVRWYIVNLLKEKLQDIEVAHTYGAVTDRKRKDLGIEKTHAADAYCIGDFTPSKRAEVQRYKKQRRNNRCLEVFYDARYIDIRDGKIKTGQELSCGRTNRRESRHTENNMRIYHGKKTKAGQRRIRRIRYPVQSGDVIRVEKKIYRSCHGTMSGGKSVLIIKAKESQTGKALTAVTSKVHVVKHVGGWKRTA